MKKKYLTFLLIAALLQGNVLAYANTEVLSTTDENIVISPRMEQTEYKYRIHNEKRQKRLWSVTYNRWIDSSWKDA